MEKELRDALAEIVRVFERDNIPDHHEVRPSGAGVWVFITFKKYERLRELLRRADSRAE